MTGPSTTDDMRRGAQWLAATGVALLAVAAVSLAGARWEQFGPGARFAILVGASAVVLGATQALRRVAPETTRALDVLVATLIPIDVAALVVVSGGTWRAALVAAGPAAVISSETLRHRDRVFVTELGTAAGGLLAMCGVAALYDLSASVLVSGLGLLAVVVAPGGRARWFGTIWALLGGLTPGLRVLDDAVFTGMGTLRDMGLLDAAEVWETAASGTLATTALLLVAVGQRRLIAALGAVGTAAATGLQIWGELDPPPAFGLIATAVVLVMVELALTVPAARQNDRASKLVEDITAVIAGVLTLAVAAVAWSRLADGESPGSHFQYTAAVLALFWLVGDLRRAAERETSGLDVYLVGGQWDPALPGLVAATGSAVYLATGQAHVLGLVLAGLGLLAVTTRRPAAPATAAVALTAAPFLTDPAAVTLVVAAIATLGLVHVASQLARRRDLRVAGFVGALAVATVVAGALAADEWGLAAAGLYWVVVLWVAARLADTAMPALGTFYRLTAQLGLLAVAIDDYTLAAVCAAAATAAHELEYRERAAVLHRGLAVVSAVLTWWFAAAAFGIDLVEVYVLPPLWLVAVVLARMGIDRWFGITVVGIYTILLTVGGRLDDGRPVHTLILGVSALALAGWGALEGERLALATGGSVAVATATFEALDRSMGIQTWGWLVVGGTAAITAACLLEVNEREPRTGGNAAAADDAFVS